MLLTLQQHIKNWSCINAVSIDAKDVEIEYHEVDEQGRWTGIHSWITVKLNEDKTIKSLTTGNGDLDDKDEEAKLAFKRVRSFYEEGLGIK